MLRQDYDPERHRPLLANENLSLRTRRWIELALVILVGAMLGWWIARAGPWDEFGERLLSGLPSWLLIFLLWRFGKPYQAAHRSTAVQFTRIRAVVLSLLVGFAALVTALVADASPTRAILIGFGVGVAGAGTALFARWRQVRATMTVCE